MLVTPPVINYNLVLELRVEEEIDHITCWHSGTIPVTVVGQVLCN